MPKSHQGPAVTTAAPPAPAAPEPTAFSLADYGNAMVQALLGLAPVEGGNAVLAAAASHPPLGQASKDGAYARDDFGALTVGHAKGGDGIWGRAKNEDGIAVVNAGRTTTGADGQKTTQGGGARIDWQNPWRSAVEWTKRQAAAKDGVDDDGELANGRERNVRLGAGGLEVAQRTAQGENKVDTGVKVGPDGVAGRFGWETEKGRGGGVGLGVGDGRVDGSVEVKPWDKVSIAVGGHTIDRTASGAAANPMLGEARAWEVSHTGGHGISGSLGFDAKRIGISVNGSRSERDRVAFQRSEAAIAKEFDPSVLGTFGAGLDWKHVSAIPALRDRYLRLRYGRRIAGIEAITDADLAGLEVGDGYTFQRDNENGWGVNGRLGPAGVGFGEKDLALSRTSIARTEEGWRIRVETRSGEEETVSASLFGVLGGSETLGEASSRAVELTIDDGPQGRAALHRLQRTGLLPGADALANPFDGDRMIVATLGRVLETTDPSTMDPKQLADFRRIVFAASGRLNAKVLGAKGRALVDASPAGASYDGHTEGRTTSTRDAVSLLGLEILHGGVQESWWDTAYRERGKTEVEKGYQRDEDWWFDPDERTGIAVNPKGAKLGGAEAEVVISSLQTTTAAQRQLVDRVGASGMDPEMRRAWAEGKVKDGERTRLALVLTGEQLATIRDHLGPSGDDFGELRNDALAGLETFGALAVHGRKTATSAELAALAAGDGGALGTWTVGAERARAVIAKVKSAEDFDALPLEEKRAFLVFASQGAQYREEWKDGSGREDAQPWRVLPLALRVQDPEQRNELIRSVFAAVEDSSLNSTCAALQLVDFIERDGALAGLSEADRRFLLAGLAVEVADGRVDGRSKALTAKLREGTDAAAKLIADGLLAERSRALTAEDERFDWSRAGPMGIGGQETSKIEANRGDAMVDWLLAAERAGDPELVAAAIAQARAKDPQIVSKILANTRHEPWRMRTAENLLKRARVPLT